jgi:hypothetical protein
LSSILDLRVGVELALSLAAPGRELLDAAPPARLVNEWNDQPHSPAVRGSQHLVQHHHGGFVKLVRAQDVPREFGRIVGLVHGQDVGARDTAADLLDAG